ncbi:MAG: amidohydrolase [Acidobacteriia bacterium]|nr:amidohydrolase family protein [Methyloceanibacter sp.]MCL6491811.1 amidohydrolase [Terriglobia bacterium]
MGIYLSERELAQLQPAEKAAFPSPVPTQVVSNGEFNPWPQTPQQRKVEARIKDLADTFGRKLGMDRRNFLRSSCGMAAAFLAMNDVFGEIFQVKPAEAANPDVAAARAQDLSKQFIFDDQLHFVRDDYNFEGLLGLAKYAAEYWNPALKTDKAGMTLDRYKFANFLKEIYLDSDTTIGLLSGAPFDDPSHWLLTNDEIKQAADTVNGIAGTKRLFFHSVITPKQPGWMDEVDRCISQIHPTSWKGYTIGDPLSPQTTKYPWRLDDEALMYPFYEKIVKAGITTVCIHKGLLPKDYESSIPGGAWKYATVEDLPKAAKDWPQINFVIYHSALRPFLESPDEDLAEFEKTGYIRWVSDLAAIPEKYGVHNVYADVGTSFANSAVTNPRFCAAMMATLIKGLGYDHVFWGTDSVWYGSPQWQIEAFRRLEVPEDMQKKFGFAPLGPANGPVKSAILGFNAARFYGVNLHTELEPWREDGLAKIKAAYLSDGPERSNAAYGYVVPAG